MKREKIYVTGACGMVGSRLLKSGCSPLLSDITDIVAFDEEIRARKPEIIINLAAKTNVDILQLNPQLAMNVNAIGAMNVFMMAEKRGIPVVQLSGDHIFDGNWFGSYRETYDLQNAEPINYYGISKLGAELDADHCENVKVVRTSALISSDRTNITHYLDKIKRGEKVYPPVFLWRSFMHINHFVESLLKYVDRFDSMPKVLHLSGSKTVSWYRLIKSHANYLCLGGLVQPRFFESGSANKAPRPKRCGLNTELSGKLGFSQYGYEDGISEYGC